MPADLEIRTDGTASIALGDETPAWHDLGDVVGRLTLDEVWRLVPELAAPVLPEPLYLADGTRVPDMVANRRQRTVRMVDGIVPIPEKYVGTVGADRYRVIQNREAFALLRAVQEYAPDVKITSAGSIRGGRQTFMVVHVGDDYLIEGDPLEQRGRYLAFVNSYDGTLALQVIRSNIRIVCSNTLDAALHYGTSAKFRHTGDVFGKVEDARLQLGFAEVHARLEAEAAKHLADLPVSDVTFEYLIQHVAPAHDAAGKLKEGRAAATAQATRDAIAKVYFESPTIGDKRGTAWGALNAVTYYSNHLAPRRDTARSTAAENRFGLVLDGDKLGKKAAEFLVPLHVAQLLDEVRRDITPKVLAEA